MDSKQFYLILPSNSDLSNTASSFITRLPRQITLNGEWEVGLAEIIYANTWHNVNSRQNMLQFFDIKNKLRVKMLIPPARYQYISDLVDTINNAIKTAGLKENYDYTPHISFNYDENRKFCNLTLNTEHVQNIKLSKHLTYMLGFLERQLITFNRIHKNNNVSITAQHSPDMLGGMHNFFIYCDIVAPQIVGNVFAPLLQVVNIEGNYTDIVNHSYISPHYIPVLKKEFNTIEINVKSDQDELVPFEFGKTIIKLHFRRL